MTANTAFLQFIEEKVFSQELATASQVKKKKMILMQKYQYLKTKSLFSGGKNLTKLNKEKTFY